MRINHSNPDLTTITVFELAELTANEEDALCYAQAIGLIPDRNYRCECCGYRCYPERQKLRKGLSTVVRCNNKLCRKRYSILRGTIFEHGHITISRILRLMYCFCLRKTVVESIFQTKLAKMTVVDWYKRFRETIANHYDYLRMNKIGGHRLTVEIDECHLFTNNRSIGRRLEGEKYWVVAGICRETRETFFAITRYRGARFLMPLIARHVEEGTTIITDGWRGYMMLRYTTYTHHIINHSVEFVSRDDPSIHTNTIERFWRDSRENVPK